MITFYQHEKRGLRRTVKYYEDLSIPDAPATKGEIRMNCPFCYDKEMKYGISDPKPDRHNSMSINRETMKGYCHRCDTAIVSRKAEEQLRLGIKTDGEAYISPSTL